MTYIANVNTISRRWLLVDASGKVLGRLASQIAAILRGKHKVEYTPHIDSGDFVIVINVDKLIVTGNKTESKQYHRHSGYPGGLKTTNFANLQARKPERPLELAVKGMLPRGPLGRRMYRKLKIYARNKHLHEAQRPELTGL
ncbi:50S ribosomal protein L13 [Coxiella endosymbiont of Amblyomma nuttalli]|nr:50S ribosomal protein L13 [Coxiella endosymbiont of Amblyomma nuttalli]